MKHSCLSFSWSSNQDLVPYLCHENIMFLLLLLPEVWWCPFPTLDQGALRFSTMWFSTKNILWNFEPNIKHKVVCIWMLYCSDILVIGVIHYPLPTAPQFCKSFPQHLTSWLSTISHLLQLIDLNLNRRKLRNSLLIWIRCQCRRNFSENCFCNLTEIMPLEKIFFVIPPPPPPPRYNFLPTAMDFSELSPRSQANRSQGWE